VSSRSGFPQDLPEVELAPGTLFVGDLHLDLEDAAAVDAFVAWLGGLEADSTPRLVILGDLFEYWLGPAHQRSAAGQRVQRALRERVDAGVAVDVLHGNRDFMLDAEFERASGATVYPLGFIGRLGSGERVLVLHGDELCTLDHAYQRLRRVIRSAPVRALGARLPASAGRALARRLRRTSRSAVDAKPAAEKAQQESACRQLCAAADAAALVCGHVHRFRDEALPDGPRWMVVDHFGGVHDAVRVVPDGSLVSGSAGAVEAPPARGARHPFAAESD